MSYRPQPWTLSSGSAAVDRVLAGRSEELLISDFAAADVASGLSRLVRMRHLSAEGASAAVADFEIWRAGTGAAVEVHAGDARLAYAYVKRFDLRLRAPDALHLAIAYRHAATLVTLDRRLSQAAATLGILAHVPQ